MGSIFLQMLKLSRVKLDCDKDKYVVFVQFDGGGEKMENGREVEDKVWIDYDKIYVPLKSNG